MTRIKTPIGLLALLAASGTSFGAIVAEWNADGYAGGGADWVGTINATVREGTPTGGVTSYNAGNNISYVNFGAPDAAFWVGSIPIAGLSQFSASAVFRTTSNGSAGENDFWRDGGLVGIELPGGGVGDWGVASAHANLFGTLEAIPEPSAAILILVGSLLALRRRRRY